MPIADWLPYPPTLYINIGFGLGKINGMSHTASICSISASSVADNSVADMIPNSANTKKYKNLIISEFWILSFWVNQKETPLDKSSLLINYSRLKARFLIRLFRNTQKRII